MDAYTALLLLAEVILVISLALMAYGLFAKGGRPKVAAAGSFVYAVFMVTQAPALYAEGSWDTATAALVAAVFFGLVGWRLLKAGVFLRPLRFPLVSAFIGTVIYFPFIRLPFLGLLAIYIVAFQSVAWVNLLGFDFSVGGYEVYGSMFYDIGTGLGRDANVSLLLNGEPSGIALVLECTGLQVMTLFACMILASWDPWRKRVIALLVNLPALHFLNLFRNGMILYLVPYKGWDFEFVHSGLGITISLVMIGVLALWTLLYLPTLHTEMLDSAKYAFTGRRYVPPVPKSGDAPEPDGSGGSR